PAAGAAGEAPPRLNRAGKAGRGEVPAGACGQEGGPCRYPGRAPGARRHPPGPEAIRRRGLPRQCGLGRRQRLLGADHFDTVVCRLEPGTTRPGKGQYSEAEPRLLDPYARLKRHKDKMPATSRARVTEALNRLIQLYDGWGRPDQAAKWREERVARTKT